MEYPQDSDPIYYAEILDPKTDLEIEVTKLSYRLKHAVNVRGALSVQNMVYYVDIKSTRSQRINCNAGASVSMATRNTLGIGIYHNIIHLQNIQYMK